MTRVQSGIAAPAGFWRRTVAYSLDFTALAALATMLMWPRLVAAWQSIDSASRTLTEGLQARLGAAVSTGAVDANALSVQLLRDPAVQAGADAVQSGIVGLLSAWLIAYAVLAALYHVGFERSPWRGSPAKHALGLSVVNARDDAMPRLWQTLARHSGGAVSWLTLNLGHALAALPPDKRALHDYLAGARVVTSDASARLPGWARAWLWLQALVLILVPAWLLLRATAALRGYL